MSNKTQPARGMRDFLPADIRKRNYVIGIIREIYESYGFEPLETPAVENLETLTGKYGEEGNQLMFKILKRGEKLDAADKNLADLALRYDLTVPLARVVANYRNELPKFFKRYQIQPVWRADRPARGRFREFYQCDVDAIGSTSMIVEAELCAAVSEILTRLGFDDFVIRINNRELLRDLLNAAEIGAEKQTDALVSLDKLDKIGNEGVLNEMQQRGIDKDSAETLLNFFAGIVEVLNDNEFIASSIEKFIGRETQGLKDLRQILEFSARSSGKKAVPLKIDASLARGLSYYTGTIMEINVPDFAGSVAGGGRYDGLIGMFGKEAIPSCGLSIGLERIIVVMEERGMFDKLIAEGKLKADSADVLITVWNEESIGESLKLANELRIAGLRVLVYPEADKLGKQFKYASQINIPFVCVLGDEELAENKVTLKNMTTGTQETLLRGEIAEKIGKS
jgi:histidyl-tRNA synthetase